MNPMKFQHCQIQAQEVLSGKYFDLQKEGENERKNLKKKMLRKKLESIKSQNNNFTMFSALVKKKVNKNQITEKN